MQDLVDMVTSEPPPLRYTVDEIVESGRRVQRRRRLGWVASGATALVVLGITAAIAIPSLAARTAPKASNVAGGPGGRPTGAGASLAPTGAAPAFPAFPTSAPPFTFTFDGYRVGKLRVAAPIDVSTAYQLASVYDDGLVTNDKAVDPNQARPDQPPPSLYAYLTVYRAGAYDPKKLTHATPVTVAGRPGLEVADTSGTGAWAAERTLAWQYTTDAWAVIRAMSSEADNPSATDLRQLAAGLRAAPPAGFKVAKTPVRMGYVPAGYRLEEAAMHAMAGLNGIAGARDGDFAGLLFSRPALPTTGLTAPFGGEDGADPPGSFQIFVVPAANSNQTASPGLSCGNGFCNRWDAGGSVNVQVSSGGRLSNGEMKKILNGITLANVYDEGTWTPVTAIP